LSFAKTSSANDKQFSIGERRLIEKSGRENPSRNETPLRNEIDIKYFAHFGACSRARSNQS